MGKTIGISDLVDDNLSLDCPRSLDLIFDPVLIQWGSLNLFLTQLAAYDTAPLLVLFTFKSAHFVRLAISLESNLPSCAVVATGLAGE